jgi:hypothetical protein
MPEHEFKKGKIHHKDPKVTKPGFKYNLWLLTFVNFASLKGTTRSGYHA